MANGGMECNVIKTISIAQYTVQTAARALNIVNKHYVYCLINSIRCHKQNDSPNRNDLSSFLKVINDVDM